MKRLFLLAVLVAGLPVGMAAQAPVVPPVRPLSLGDALRLGEGASEAVGIARAGVQRARGQVVQTRSGYLPQLTGSATYTRTLRSQFSALNSGGGPDTAAAPAPSSCNAFHPDPSLPVGERLDSLESSVTCLSTVNPFASFRNLPFGREHEYDFSLSLSQKLFDRPLMGRIRAAAAGRTRAEMASRPRGAARARRDPGVLRRDAQGPARVHRRIDAGAGGQDAARVQLGRQVGTQSEFDLLRARVTRDNQRPVVIRRRPTGTWPYPAPATGEPAARLRFSSPPSWARSDRRGERGVPPRATPTRKTGPRCARPEQVRAAGLSRMAAGAERLPSLQLHLDIRPVRLSQHAFTWATRTSSPTGRWRSGCRCRSSPAAGSAATRRWPRRT